MPFSIIRNDITKLNIDAIVNAANTSLLMGGGVCGAIFRAAGADLLQKACDELAPIKTGEAVITPGFNLPAKHVIHTAGPIYSDGRQGEEALLRACYVNSLELAVKHNCGSIAFPLISSGIYGYPKTEALRVAATAIRDFIQKQDMDVSLAVFEKDALNISEELYGAVESFINEYYVEERQSRERLRTIEESRAYSTDTSLDKHSPMIAESVAARVTRATGASLEDLVGNLDESFSAMLLRLIDATGKKDADIYHRANIDRRLFSKIRNKESYMPGKATVLAFAIALELNIEQTADLLKRAGFALSRSRKFDVIVEYFITSRKYDIYQINEVLFSYDQPLLGG
ncbi:MAG: macro domain-containing protein [Peptococcaceae bacterium]|nr:macro domain-containing protein [Peptococcaceae bacterium]